MLTIQQLREKRSEFARNLRNLIDSNPGSAWKQNPENQTRYDSLTAEITDLDNEIARTQRALDLAAAEAHRVDEGAARVGVSRDEFQARHREAFSAFLRRGVEGMTPEQREVIRRASNVMSTTVPAQGGYTVPTETVPRLIEAMKAYGGVREVANVVSTASGNPMQFPTTDPTSEVGELLAQNVPATDLDFAFGIVTLGSYTYSSKAVPVPMELLEDAAVDLEGHIVNRCAMRIGRLLNQHLTNGTGIGQPTGCLTASTLGKTGAAGQQQTFIYDDLVDLIHSIDPLYRSRPGCRFMWCDTTLAYAKKLKDTTGRPLWMPGVIAGEPDTILGYRYVINQDMPDLNAGHTSILFGDFGAYTLRDCMGVTMFRFTDSAFTRSHQVGFLAFSRHDGNLLEAGALKHYANPV